ncbi:MAG: hypothetical protein A2504_09495 [Bdellovibrionales bacterium RIFOXYD12_FULL_39_22]|nr:MAG: hypothetical protein A2385_12985 [Bdellovibrionales bacterium RIFOXYB1_FULL_39_21]OFZ40960.1 MAG: hypothetical protein A2485_16495 [Bdellovibrionales bacterium RIFOXYC12_FULL_39_17]OFZ44788.1 MAG: hypothetical protein A2404_09785 [Bdellovibrionales bacterium RIFOXYC1_FULL_39_130]OFZ73597.1 MAG: hypothetical protein A2451_06475 [Bdellovibrionales bacterium RIFOXYC2_FULL_39_8]OFZ74253.1 MAG: hypothetical protein A2560_16750 [Bdellovibrionales bacterium RIFOXYD1_FULL_39_84]OFZ92117.1 MAG:
MDGSSFLGLPFAPVSLESHSKIKTHLERNPSPIAGYTFASMVAWAENYNFHWAFFNPDCLLIARPYQNGNNQEWHLLQPIGQLPDNFFPWLFSKAERLPYPLEILSCSADFLEKITPYTAHFEIEEDRAGANYIYLASDLATLASSKYSKKRNLVAQFLKLYPNWEATPISKECNAHCLEILMSMASADGIPSNDPSLAAELRALEFTLKHFNELDQAGVAIRIDGQPVAFSIFERQSSEMAVVHFEKADRKYKGLYQIINRETSKQIQSLNYTLINREEDVGDDGLRQAKLSYAPVELTSVFNLLLKQCNKLPC